MLLLLQEPALQLVTSNVSDQPQGQPHELLTDVVDAVAPGAVKVRAALRTVEAAPAVGAAALGLGLVIAGSAVVAMAVAIAVRVAEVAVGTAVVTRYNCAIGIFIVDQAVTIIVNRVCTARLRRWRW